MMKAFAIVIEHHVVSEAGYKRLVESSDEVGNPFPIVRWDAVTPTVARSYMNSRDLRWNWPKHETIDITTGLRKVPYKGSPEVRCACAVSHYQLWQHSIFRNEPILILEHDSEFVRQLTIDPDDMKVDILGINDPRGATRKASIFHEKLQNSIAPIQLVPHVDTDPTIPHGLAGNSAYIITPQGAKDLMHLVHLHGLWPNDAIMCRQLIPMLSTTRTYYTRVQGLPSTTTV